MDGFIGTRQLAESEIRANVSEQLRSGVVIFAPVLGFGSVCIVLFVLKSLTGFKLFPALGESMANAVLGGGALFFSFLWYRVMFYVECSAARKYSASVENGKLCVTGRSGRPTILDSSQIEAIEFEKRDWP